MKAKLKLKALRQDVNAIDSPEFDYLYTKVSQIENAGEGLFTAIDIYKSEIIAIFKGEILDAKSALAKSQIGEDQYFIMLLDGRTMDSAHVHCFAKYANDANGFSISPFKNNAHITLNENEDVCLVAKFKIKAGSEIFCSYGKRYWLQYY